MVLRVRCHSKRQMQVLSWSVISPMGMHEPSRQRRHTKLVCQWITCVTCTHPEEAGGSVVRQVQDVGKAVRLEDTDPEPRQALVLRQARAAQGTVFVHVHCGREDGILAIRRPTLEVDGPMGAPPAAHVLVRPCNTSTAQTAPGVG